VIITWRVFRWIVRPMFGNLGICFIWKIDRARVVVRVSLQWRRRRLYINNTRFIFRGISIRIYWRSEWHRDILSKNRQLIIVDSRRGRKFKHGGRTRANALTTGCTAVVDYGKYPCNDCNRWIRCRRRYSFLNVRTLPHFPYTKFLYRETVFAMVHSAASQFLVTK